MCLAVFCSCLTIEAQRVSQDIDAILDGSGARGATWGIAIRDLTTGRTIAEKNADRLMIPASNAKLFTTLAALEQLGPDFRYETRLYMDGEVINGTLHGGLVVRGSGDPSIGGRPDTLRPYRIFEEWVAALHRLGIRKITGDIVGDDDLFDDVAIGYNWESGDLPYWYGAQIGALSFSENTVDVAIKGRRNGNKAVVTWEPFQTDYVRIVNRTLTKNGGSIQESYAREEGTNTIVLASRVPRGITDLESLSIDNPTLFFVHVFTEALERAGIRVNGRPLDSDEFDRNMRYDRLSEVATYTSPTLAEIVAVTNKESHNLYAEMLLKTIAARGFMGNGNLAGSARRGVEVGMRTWARAGVDEKRVRLVDASGLSRDSRVDASSTVAMLEYAWNYRRTDLRDAYYDSLPIGGRDGSLKKRFTTGAAKDNVRAKTGTFRGVCSLSGYVTSRNGHVVAFAIYANGYRTSAAPARRVQDAIVELLANSTL